jgi:hemerythrin
MTAQYFIWDPKYEIGHALIDSQHKIFLMLLNKLAVVSKSAPERDYLFRVLHELQRYAEFHFLSEENLMIESHYPEIARHEQIHSKILMELGLLIDHVAQNRANVDDVVTFVKNWVFDHIAREDQKIATYIAGHSQ